MQQTVSSMGANAALWAMLSRPFPRVLSKACPIATYGFIFRRKIGTIRIGDGYPMTIALGKSVELLPRMSLLQDFICSRQFRTGLGHGTPNSSVRAEVVKFEKLIAIEFSKSRVRHLIM